MIDRLQWLTCSGQKWFTDSCSIAVSQVEVRLSLPLLDEVWRCQTSVRCHSRLSPDVGLLMVHLIAGSQIGVCSQRQLAAKTCVAAASTIRLVKIIIFKKAKKTEFSKSFKNHSIKWTHLRCRLVRNVQVWRGIPFVPSSPFLPIPGDPLLRGMVTYTMFLHYFKQNIFQLYIEKFYGFKAQSPFIYC